MSTYDRMLGHLLWLARLDQPDPDPSEEGARQLFDRDRIAACTRDLLDRLGLDESDRLGGDPGPLDGWDSCKVADCPSVDPDRDDAEADRFEEDGVTHGIPHHNVGDFWLVRTADALPRSRTVEERRR